MPRNSNQDNINFAQICLKDTAFWLAFSGCLVGIATGGSTFAVNDCATTFCNHPANPQLIFRLKEITAVSFMAVCASLPIGCLTFCGDDFLLGFSHRILRRQYNVDDDLAADDFAAPAVASMR